MGVGEMGMVWHYTLGRKADVVNYCCDLSDVSRPRSVLVPSFYNIRPVDASTKVYGCLIQGTKWGAGIEIFGIFGLICRRKNDSIQPGLPQTGFLARNLVRQCCLRKAHWQELHHGQPRRCSNE